MILQITAAGRTRAVEVGRHGEKFLVSIDGRQRQIDVKVVGGLMSILVEAGSHTDSGFSQPSRSYQAALSTSGDGGMTVHVDGVPVEVSIAPTRPSWAQARGSAHTGDAAGPQRVAAPMPGKIVKLLVKPGDRVEPLQGLVVVEAMKMENELRARAAGTVTEVRVAEGSSVEAGAILVILE